MSSESLKARQRSIIHLDMDAFYPAVEALDKPELKGKPVIVGGNRERGVVSSASYEARRFGVHSAQPIATAIKLCPEGIFMPVRMTRYKEVSRQVFEIFHCFTPLVEPLSIDEAFLDLTGAERLMGQTKEIAKKIKETVLKKTGLTVSAGVASSKFVAKIASDIDKPDGLIVVPPDRVREFLDPLPVKKMWGVGKITQQALARLNVKTFKDLRQIPVEILEKNFGKHGAAMHLLSMGIDERDVEPEREAKSIGHEQTFMEDILNPDQARKEILSLSNRIALRMRREEIRGSTVSLKVKYSDFTQITRAATLPEPTDDSMEIYSTSCGLLKKTAVGKRPVRLLGISLSRLSSPEGEKQLFLFDRDKGYRKRKDLNTALDSICDKFGEKSIRPATLISKS
ncbi:MAG: DNA polymerase IV [Desulfobacteraceae bacterium]|nr:DNA polymerase IV [Desulfobacteraceae bacterium]MBL7216543.1 DNA polymerase IV [Desulfobacteraceae bacterium]